MRKVLLFVFCVVALFACEGPMGPEGPEGQQGPKGKDGSGTNWYVKSFTISKNDWQLVGEPNELNSYFFVDKALPELTDNVFKKGTVVAYIQTAKDVKNGLPFVLHKGGTDSIGEFLWTETYDFDFYPGGVGFYVTYSNFNTGVAPGDETFSMVLMW